MLFSVALRFFFQNFDQFVLKIVNFFVILGMGGKKNSQCRGVAAEGLLWGVWDFGLVWEG